jgi:hypothetical protein
MRWSLLLLTALGVSNAGLASVASAQPAPATSIVPSCILLVGSNGIAVDPLGAFTVVVNDAGGVAIPGCLVTVSFLGCPYAGLCPGQLDPAIVAVDCAAKSVTGVTDVFGICTMSVMGMTTPVPCPADAPGCAAVVATAPGFAPVVLGTTSIAAFDLVPEPGAGMTANDLSEWLGEFFCGSGSPRLDYDCDGVVGGGDLSFWLFGFFAGGSVLNCAPAGICK